eukprot:gb/GECG01006938.1/.p1 GENE.gb/GECG01006938.1/~~gb/GECG01006938.1/.p1  ORF type:complete len:1231 (+),score=146.14 gb/GECG01006938.1/:1-3693(+)
MDVPNAVQTCLQYIENTKAENGVFSSNATTLATEQEKWFWWPRDSGATTLNAGPAKEDLSKLVEAIIYSGGGVIVIGVKYLERANQLKLQPLWKNADTNNGYESEQSLQAKIRDIMTKLRMFERETIGDDPQEDYIMKILKTSVDGTMQFFAAIGVEGTRRPPLERVSVRSGAFSVEYQPDKLVTCLETEPLHGWSRSINAQIVYDSLRLGEEYTPESSAQEFKFFPWYEPDNTDGNFIKNIFREYIPQLLSTGQKTEICIGVADNLSLLPFPANPEELKELVKEWVQEALSNMFPQLKQRDVSELRAVVNTVKIEEEDISCGPSTRWVQELTVFDSNVAKRILRKLKEKNRSLLALRAEQSIQQMSVIPRIEGLKFGIPMDVRRNRESWNLIEECVNNGEAEVDESEFGINFEHCCVSITLPHCSGLFVEQKLIRAKTIRSSLRPWEYREFWDLLLLYGERHMFATLRHFCGPERYRILAVGSSVSMPLLDKMQWNETWNMIDQTHVGLFFDDGVSPARLLPCCLVVTHSSRHRATRAPLCRRIQELYETLELDRSPQTTVMVFTDDPVFAKSQYEALLGFTNMLLFIFPLSSLNNSHTLSTAIVFDEDEVTFTPQGVKKGGNAECMQSDEVQVSNVPTFEYLDKPVVEDHMIGDIFRFLSGETPLTAQLLGRQDRVDVDRTVTSTLCELFSNRLVSMQQRQCKYGEMHLSRIVMRCGLRTAVMRALDTTIRGTLSDYFLQVTVRHVNERTEINDILAIQYKEAHAYVFLCQKMLFHEARAKLTARLPSEARVLLVSLNDAPFRDDDAVFTPVLSIDEMSNMLSVLRAWFPSSTDALSVLQREIDSNRSDPWLRTNYSAVLTALRGRCCLLQPVIQHLCDGEDKFVLFVERLSIIELFMGGFDHSSHGFSSTQTLIKELKSDLGSYGRLGMGLLVRNDWARRIHPFLHPVVAMGILRHVCWKRLTQAVTRFLIQFPIIAERLLIRYKARYDDKLSHLIEILFHRDMNGAYELLDLAIRTKQTLQQPTGVLCVQLSKLILLASEEFSASIDKLCLLYHAYRPVHDAGGEQDEKTFFHFCYVGLCVCYVAATDNLVVEVAKKLINTLCQDINTLPFLGPAYTQVVHNQLELRKQQAEVLRSWFESEEEILVDSYFEKHNVNGQVLPRNSRRSTSSDTFTAQWLDDICPCLRPNDLQELKKTVVSQWRYLSARNDGFLAEPVVREWLRSTND